MPWARCTAPPGAWWAGGTLPRFWPFWRSEWRKCRRADVSYRFSDVPRVTKSDNVALRNGRTTTHRRPGADPGRTTEALPEKAP